MFMKKKTDPIEEGILKTTFTLEEIRENYVPKKVYRHQVHYNWIMEIAVTFIAVICLIIGFCIGTATKCLDSAQEKYVHEKAEEVMSDRYSDK